MKWSQIKPREKRLLIFTFLVVFAGVNYLGVVPWWEQCRDRAAELEKLQREMNNRREVVSRAPAWGEELAKLTQSSGADPQHVASQEKWMKHFEEMAKEGGVELQQRRSLKSEGKTTANQLRVDSSFQGSFETVVRFLFLLMTDKAHPQVESCQLSPVKAGEDKLRGQLMLTVNLKPATK